MRRLSCWRGSGHHTRDLVICRLCSPSAAQQHPPSPLRHRRPQGIVLRNEGGVTLPCEPVVVVRVGGVDADTMSIRRQARSVSRHVHRPLLALHHDRVANLYAELRIGDGVREKSGRGGVARSKPKGSMPESESGDAHASWWLGPASPGLVPLGPASPSGEWGGFLGDFSIHEP